MKIIFNLYFEVIGEVIGRVMSGERINRLSFDLSPETKRATREIKWLRL